MTAAAARWLGVKSSCRKRLGNSSASDILLKGVRIQYKYLGALDHGTLLGTSVTDSLNESYYRVYSVETE